MRFLRVVLALAFGLAMAGQDTRACSHHHDAHHKGTQDSAPQACCPASVSGSLPTISAGWVAGPLPVVAVDVEPGRSVPLPSRSRLLPFALAPPLRLTTSFRSTTEYRIPNTENRQPPSGGAACLFGNRRFASSSCASRSGGE